MDKNKFMKNAAVVSAIVLVALIVVVFITGKPVWATAASCTALIFSSFPIIITKTMQNSGKISKKEAFVRYIKSRVYFAAISFLSFSLVFDSPVFKLGMGACLIINPLLSLLEMHYQKKRKASSKDG
ncbi:MAG: hypothetical protein IJS94_07165, partial [Clostridia bacterium]|nr:hypothetical protein [Clostridia bacterium]